MNDTPKSKWPWRLLRWGLIALAVLVTLAAVLVTEENWRGKRAWENYRRDAEARGERLDLASVIPPAVPDDQNFFCAAIVATALTNSTIFNIYRGEMPNWITNGGNWQKGRFADLEEWQRAFRQFSATPEGKTNGFPVAAQPQTPAADVLLALSVYDPALEQFRQASLRPHARMPLSYERGFEDAGSWLPALAAEKRWAQFLQLRTLADLQAGQSQAGLEDTKLFLRVIDSLRDQPYLISHLVRMAMWAIAVQPVYEGLAQHRWNDAELATLEAALGKEDFLADFQMAMRGERTCAIFEFERQRLTRRLVTPGGIDGTEMVTNNLTLMPSAYFYQNELAFARLYEKFILPMVDLTNRTVSLAAFRANETEHKAMRKHVSPYTMQALMLLPDVSKSVQKFAIMQGQVDLIRTACALERYRLAHGEYPAALDALSPQFIESVPHDLINGQPLHYRRADDGKFVLYSVGWNESDDGGTNAFNKNGRIVWQEGDWVWKY
jgi:hypothetical protein